MTENKKPCTHVQLTLTDGRIYQIEAKEVAHYYAWFYASNAGNGGADYRDDFDRAMNDEEILDDWVSDMEWYDDKHKAVLISGSGNDELWNTEIVSKKYLYEETIQK